ncbi:MAG TPA: NirD/YgiW/YdeI family stress tolerance protein [Nitrospirales bacterium]|nr:NirD/YgiW/YdeI family stress tolerance protein [Nitrospirales bacterium]
MSKHIIFMTVGFLLFSTLTLWAKFQGPGTPGITSISAAQEAVDDSWVVLSGTILRQVGEERYLFRDPTGTMIVEIDHEDWGNVTANPETILRVSGEIDRAWGTTEIEVKQIEMEIVSSPDLSRLQSDHSVPTNPIDGMPTSDQSVTLHQLH